MILISGIPEQGFEDSDSSVFSTPSPKSKMRGPTPPFLETQHASLKRKKIPEKQQTHSKHVWLYHCYVINRGLYP